MRQSVAAFALIHRQRDGSTVWLAQWNEGWKRFNFVGGHKRAAESFRQCAIREVSEELGLEPGTDFSVAEKPTAHLEYAAWSQSAGEQTEYTIELFDVDLRGQKAEERVAGNQLNRWLDEGDIRRKMCSDGLAVSETMELLLVKAHLWTTQSNSLHVDTRANGDKER